ncbi:MAG: undecaprenyl-diphosphate phosphatase [Hellea sp.]|nr:undecaprenyl-diphosphate phosphatase [Hellea sp.]
MPIHYLILLAIIQGLTEFLPVSSSAHLILPEAMGIGKQGALIDVMAHFGSLFAVLIYFRKDVAAILLGLNDLLAKRLNNNSALALNLIVATPPALLVGAFLALGGYDELLRKAWIIGAASIVFGIILWWADIRYARTRTTEELTWRGAFNMGLAQTLAFIPGTSRSGITITAGRMMNMTRVEAARFSMLMSLPIIGASGFFAIIKLSQTDAGMTANLTDGMIVAALSFFSAYIAIAFFMKLVSRIGMFPFMLYRVALGLVIFFWLVF